jgi:hypothetical protein
MWSRLLPLVLPCLCSCGAVKGVSRVAWNAVTSPVDTFKDVFGKKEQSAAAPTAKAGEPMTYSDRVRREQMAMKTYMKNPNVDPAAAGLAFDTSAREFESKSFHSKGSFVDNKKPVLPTYSTRDFLETSTYTGAGKESLSGTRAYRGLREADARDTRSYATSAAGEQGKGFRTSKSREGSKTVDTGTIPEYEKAAASPRTIQDDLVRDMYDKKYSVEEIQRALQR